MWGTVFLRQTSIYMAQLGTDGEGNKSQFSFPCVINTSNDPQLGSCTQQLWDARFTFLLSYHKVPDPWPQYTQGLVLLEKRVFEKCFVYAWCVVWMPSLRCRCRATSLTSQISQSTACCCNDSSLLFTKANNVEEESHASHSWDKAD